MELRLSTLVEPVHKAGTVYWASPDGVRSAEGWLRPVFWAPSDTLTRKPLCYPPVCTSGFSLNLPRRFSWCSLSFPLSYSDLFGRGSLGAGSGAAVGQGLTWMPPPPWCLGAEPAATDRYGGCLLSAVMVTSPSLTTATHVPFSQESHLSGDLCFWAHVSYTLLQIGSIWPSPA